MNSRLTRQQAKALARVFLTPSVLDLKALRHMLGEQVRPNDVLFEVLAIEFFLELVSFLESFRQL